MRIESVTAHAFGPLHGETLEFGAGLTVVFGPNESAKSSWHAATYAGVCGRPSGRQTEEGVLFEQRHRPWGGGEWLVETRLRLDDGRQVRLRQNLGNRADRQAIELPNGADVAAEIMHDGAPDAARWLGLDRESFRATACVAQSDILKVRDAAHGLQSFLQHAAATAGTGRPIDAITRLTRFQAERVGTDRTPTKPLRRAVTARAVAQAALVQARSEHEAYERCLVEAGQAEVAAARARSLVTREEWAVAAAAAAALRERVDAGTALTRELTEVEAAGEAVAPATVEAVASALYEWNRAPAAVGSGAHAGASPLAGDGLGGLSDDEFWRLVSDLQTRVPEPEPAVTARLAQARQRVRMARRASAVSKWLVVSGAVGALAGVGLMMAGPRLVGATLLVLGIIAALLGLLPRRGRATAAQAELEAAESELTASSGAARAALATREAALARCTTAGLPGDPETLRALALSRERQLAVDNHTRDGHDEERLRAGTALLAAVALARVDASTPAEAAWALTQWQRQRAADTERRDHGHELRRRLAAELGDSDLPDLDRQATAVQLRAARLRDELLGSGHASDDLSEYLREQPDDPGEERVGSLRTYAVKADAAAAAADVAAGSATPTVSVAEAEEQLAGAEAELARVTELRETLDLTLRFMEDAQQRARRTIAPRLRDAVQAALPQVTSGRYIEATVDPQTLEVTVWGEGGAPRPAHLLSFGTAEQIYLLLRIALAEHLVTEGMSCPLIFDDVTVHADKERTTSILELLLAESQRRQIIVFTQQEQVRGWAREHLVGAPHAVRDLPPVVTV